MLLLLVSARVAGRPWRQSLHPGMINWMAVVVAAKERVERRRWQVWWGLPVVTERFPNRSWCNVCLAQKRNTHFFASFFNCFREYIGERLRGRGKMMMILCAAKKLSTSQFGQEGNGKNTLPKPKTRIVVRRRRSRSARALDLPAPGWKVEFGQCAHVLWAHVKLITDDRADEMVHANGVIACHLFERMWRWKNGPTVWRRLLLLQNPLWLGRFQKRPRHQRGQRRKGIELQDHKSHAHTNAHKEVGLGRMSGASKTAGKNVRPGMHHKPQRLTE